MDFGFRFSLLIIISFSAWLVATVGETNRISLCPLIQSIYQLGDSIADTGNDIRVLPEGPFLPVARFPYGETFPGRPTGRWSDGRLMIDFTAASLGLPLLNPYLDKNASFKYGVNFAVAGSPALSRSFFDVRGIIIPPYVAPLDVQLSWFRTHLATICSTPLGCANKLKRALIFVGAIGGNDVNYAFTQGKSQQEIQTYVPFINQAIINATREIILAGAIRIVVPGNFPFGCVPYTITAFASNDSTAYDEFGCIKFLNDFTKNQNSNLQLALNSLRQEFPDVAIVYADYYNAFLSILRQAPILGFDPRTLLKACCGSEPYSPLSPQFCGNPGVPLCRNPNQYINWDGLHFTEMAYRSLSRIVFRSILPKIKCLYM